MKVFVLVGYSFIFTVSVAEKVPSLAPIEGGENEILRFKFNTNIVVVIVPSIMNVSSLSPQKSVKCQGTVDYSETVSLNL
jgi:hypothetical protein